MRKIRFLRWDILRWVLFSVGMVAFLGGLGYSTYISRLNTKTLNRAHTEIFPIFEKSTLLKIRFILFVDEFRKPIMSIPEWQMSNVAGRGEAFLRVLEQIELLTGDHEAANSIRLKFNDYFQLGMEIIRSMEGGSIPSTHPMVVELDGKQEEISNTIDHLDEAIRNHFHETLSLANDYAEHIMVVGFYSSIWGILIGGFLSLNVILNRRLSKDRNVLETRVRARTQELESFVYTISHDLKTPVVSMEGMASMFEEDYGHLVDEKGKYYLNRIKTNAHFMEDLIGSLLTLTQIGKASESSEKVKIENVLNEVLETQKALLSLKKIQVFIHGSLPPFQFDRVHLIHVFQNLVSNAEKFMGNQPHPRIEIGGKKTGHWTEFYVKDNGIGIEPGYHGKIFGIFQRLREVEEEGIGVGLSIVKKIMELAGGKVWVESKKGKGSTFFVRFP